MLQSESHQKILDHIHAVAPIDWNFPKNWSNFYDRITEGFSKEQRPPVPLILAASTCSSEEKRSRFIEQLVWADQNHLMEKAIGYLSELPPDQWDIGEYAEYPWWELLPDQATTMEELIRALVWHEVPDHQMEHYKDALAKSDISKVTEIDFSDQEISDISALQDLVGLKSLSMMQNSICDLSPLGGCRNIQTIFLGENQVEDISPLAGLTELRTLCLNQNKISNINALSGMEHLEFLALDENSVSDLSPIANLLQLNCLDVSDNLAADLSPLMGLKHMDNLNVRNNKNLRLTEVQNLQKELPNCEISHNAE
jgi:Leucine-rich repeat (LRR) protein